MFGDLFNEDLSVSGPGCLTQVATSEPSPPPHRLQYGLAGIDNQGATCYLNSLLQTLLLTPEFREKLFELTDKDLGQLDDKDKPDAKVRVIPIELQRLFSQLLLINKQSVSTVDLTNSFGWTNQEGFQQHDVQELNRILFSAIEESLVGTLGQDIIKELYHGLIVNQITCLRCKKISEREEDFLDLTLAVAGAQGLEAALKKSYLDVEMMDGRNQYRCERCGTYTDATKGAKLRKLPPILTISLLRFSYDFAKMSRYKENGRFTFPMELDINPYSDKDLRDSNKDLYELFSVVVHRGGAYGGHYFAYIRDIDGIGHWESPDDSVVTKRANPKDTGLDIIECQSPVDLIESILAQVPHNAMSVDKLCAEMSKTTGVAWNKRFKKSHGPINKFLKACDSFDYNPDSNWVSLAHLAKESSVDPAPLQDKENTLETSSDGGDALKSSQSPPNTEDDKGSSTPTDTHRWFSFNDSRVYPINTKEIEKQFSGKESAYMLFYRLKSLTRPDDAKSQWSNKIPQAMNAEVVQLNKALEQQRQEYEVSMNKISVKLMHQEDFVFDGLLRAKPSDWQEAQHFTLNIDRRKPLLELRTLIFETLDRHPEYKMFDFSLHRIKACCGGFHLYEELNEEDKSLQDLGLTNDCSLFVWNGAVIEDQFVPVGEECEPVLLTVRDLNVETLLTQVVVARNKSLSQLYTVVDQTMGLEAGELRLSRLTGMGEGGKPQLSELICNEDITVAQAGLNTGDVLVAAGTNDGFIVEEPSPVPDPSPVPEPSSSGAGSSVDQDPEWSITLQNRLSESEDGSKGHNMTGVIKTRGSVMIRDLKIQALNMLQIHNANVEMVRLREDHISMGLRPPLREGLCLADAGISDGGCLVLENGRPPQDSEMTVTVNKVVSGKLLSKQEFLVDRELTVQDMLQAACRCMDCDVNSQWYLSKTDMFGDPIESLADRSVTLMDALISDGDMLVLQNGTVLRKDEVGINLWLASDATKDGPGLSSGDSRAAEPVMRQDEEDKVMLELAAKLSLNGDIASKDLNPLNKCLYPNLQSLFDNCLVVQRAMGIEDLKQALLGTEQCQSLRIPTSNFMRLRLTENSRLKAVLRNNSQTLRHHNSSEPLNLAIQILPHEETLGVHEVLLQVAQKISQSRFYTPSKEFVWNTSGGQGPSDLKRAIASRLGLPLHDVLLAKYNPDSFSWSVLQEVVQKPGKTNKGKRGKSGPPKTNLRQAPYYVQDGDLIGVKVISEDKGYFERDDFLTQEDIEQQLIMKQIAEEKKRLREERRKLQGQDHFSGHRRPEVPLTIKVDKFS